MPQPCAKPKTGSAMTVLASVIRSLIGAALPALVVASARAAVRAAGSKGPPNALQGFSQNRDQPVQIEAATLEVRDKDKVATFSGDVQVTQGDTDMRCKSLLVFYEQDGERGADKGKTLQAADARPRRPAEDQAAGSARRRGGDAEGADRHRRSRHVRHEDQYRHADRQCGDDARARTCCAAIGWWSI